MACHGDRMGISWVGVQKKNTPLFWVWLTPSNFSLFYTSLSMYSMPLSSVTVYLVVIAVWLFGGYFVHLCRGNEYTFVHFNTVSGYC